jgi:AcrR family transcriptional regulator
MATPASKNGSDTRQQILSAALRRFAHCGYAAASIQEIVDEARVTKPALYYYFPSKARLYQALVDSAHDERFRLMREAAARGQSVAEKLAEIVTAVFEHAAGHRDLMRLAFASAFAAPGEAPGGAAHCEKGRRNFEFVRGLIESGQQAGELSREFDFEELAFGIYGQIITYTMIHVLLPDCRLDRRTAQRIVDLFLAGAAARLPPRNAPSLRRSKRGAPRASRRQPR